MPSKRRRRDRSSSTQLRLTRALLHSGLAVFLLVLVIDLGDIVGQLPQRLFGDEWRYLHYARNLLDGYYSPRERVFLWNGPAYPLLLVPFVSAGWEDGARYANALFHATAALYAWLVVRSKLPDRWALAVVAGIAVYPPLREHLPLLYTETLSFALVTAWVFHSLRGEQSRTHRIVAGGCLGVLCLTKVVFGVALLAFLAVVAARWFRSRDARSRSYLEQALVAFALCVPYLAYTQQLTGRPLYWSSAWPNSFYWLSSPFPEEWGDWYHSGWVNRDAILRAHHKAIFDQTSGLTADPTLSASEQLFNISSPEAADVFLKQALQNVREHPLKFALNWCANISRFFFDVPVSVRGTKVLNTYSASNLALLLGIAFVAVRAALRRIPPSAALFPIALFSAFAFGAYSVSSAMARFLVPLAPIWWLLAAHWFADARSGRRPIEIGHSYSP